MDKQIKAIQAFWHSQAIKYGTGQEASWVDILVQKEIVTVAQYLQKGDKVLDIGCANGYSSIQIAKKKEVNLLGVDYVPRMIAKANLAKKSLPKSLRDRLTFRKGNILSLNFPDNTFDKIISIRCICNLTSWKEQEKGLRELWRTLKPGGTLLLSEPSQQGLEDLNNLGRFFNLESLSSPWHNVYIDEHKLVKFIKPFFNLKINRFSSTYYLCSRIIYRWFIQDVKKLQRKSIFNRLGLILPSFGNWGVQTLYIFKKKD